MAYNLTEKQKELAIWIVDQNRNHGLEEEFYVFWRRSESEILGHAYGHSNLNKGALTALANDNLIVCVPNLETRITSSGTSTRTSEIERSRSCILVARIFEAVDSNFASPDTSFITHLTPLADITNLDSEIKLRCLPILGAGSADPKLWDSAVRTAGVILEERLRKVAQIQDPTRIGRQPVNDIFGQKGKFAHYFKDDSVQLGYREIYAGITGVFRNPSSHRLVDPTPEDGGAFIVFINVLLKMLEDLQREEDD